MKELLAKIESYGFRCEGGPLTGCRDWQELLSVVALLPEPTQERSASPIGWGSLQKPKPYRNVQYMLWIKTQPCLVCIVDATRIRFGGVGSAVEAAHTGKHGLGTKASDFRCVPLCPQHHRGPQGLDTLGPERFEAMYNVNLRELVLQHVEAWLAQGNSL